MIRAPSFRVLCAAAVLWWPCVARGGDSGVPVATTYRAFGPLPIGVRGGSPLAVLGDDVLAVLQQLDDFPSECATGGVATWRQSFPYNASSPGGGVITIPFSDAELPYESYAIANFTVPKPPAHPAASSTDPYPYILRCENPALIRRANPTQTSTNSPTADHDTPFDDVHCAADVYGDGRALCPVFLAPDTTYSILVHLSSGANTSSLLCNYFYPPHDSVDRSLLVALNDSVAPSVVVEVSGPGGGAVDSSGRVDTVRRPKWLRQSDRVSSSSSLSFSQSTGRGHVTTDATDANANADDKTQQPESRSSPQSVARLAGPHCSVTVMNAHPDAWATAGSARIVEAPHGIALSPQSSADEHYPLPRLAPRQIRQLRLDLSISASAFRAYDASGSGADGAGLPRQTYVVIEVRYEFPAVHRARFNLTLGVARWAVDRAYHFTYVDVDGTVQAAAVLPPSKACAPNCSVLLSTHGAGVDAVGEAWTNSYRVQQFAWVLLPTGRRKFGLNWEGPQMRTALTALRALAAHMPGVPPPLAPAWRPRPDAWLQAGHSMGGHGALLLATHFPDALTAALPAMGWLRLSTYGAENARSEDLSFSDASLRALLAVASAEYSADLYAENLLGIPFLARVGSDDDNVPPSNLRKFVRLLKENEMFHNMSSVVSLSEVPGKGHWFDGVVDDDVLQPFLDAHLGGGGGRKPALPARFSMLTMNAGSSGSRGGLRIVLQEVVFEQSRLQVERDGGDWHVRTENVRRFRYEAVYGISERPERLFIDDRSGSHPFVIPLSVRSPSPTPTPTDPADLPADPDDQPFASVATGIDFCASDVAASPADDQRPVLWRVCDKHADMAGTDRLPDLYGPAFSVLARRKVVVVYPERARRLRDVAVRYANALYIRGISAAVTPDSGVTLAGEGGTYNTVLLGGPDINRLSAKYAADPADSHTADVRFFPTTKTPTTGAVPNNRTLRFCVAARCFASGGTGVAFLARGPGRALLFYAAGTDAAGLDAALDWLPYGPSSNVPEWVVASAARGWGFRGLGGVVALGYWDRSWKLEPRRTYPAEFTFDAKTPGRTCARRARVPLFLHNPFAFLRHPAGGSDATMASVAPVLTTLAAAAAAALAVAAAAALCYRQSRARKTAYARLQRHDPTDRGDERAGSRVDLGIDVRAEPVADARPPRMTTPEACATSTSAAFSESAHTPLQYPRRQQQQQQVQSHAPNGSLPASEGALLTRGGDGGGETDGRRTTGVAEERALLIDHFVV